MKGQPGPSSRSCLLPCLTPLLVTYTNPLLARRLQFYPVGSPQGTKPGLPSSQVGKLLQPQMKGPSFIKHDLPFLSAHLHVSTVRSVVFLLAKVVRSQGSQCSSLLTVTMDHIDCLSKPC